MRSDPSSGASGSKRWSSRPWRMFFDYGCLPGRLSGRLGATPAPRWSSWAYAWWPVHHRRARPDHAGGWASSRRSMSGLLVLAGVPGQRRLPGHARLPAGPSYWLPPSSPDPSPTSPSGGATGRPGEPDPPWKPAARVVIRTLRLAPRDEAHDLGATSTRRTPVSHPGVKRQSHPASILVVAAPVAREASCRR